MRSPTKTSIRRENASPRRNYQVMMNDIFETPFARTSSMSRIFQMETRSLCITSKHFLKLKLRKCIPDAIALQYSGNRSEGIENKLRAQFTLFPDSKNSKTPILSLPPVGNLLY